MMEIANWLWPQWTMVILFGVALLCEAALHDRPKTGKFNILTGIIRTALTFWILASGGFFK